ncbi:MAG TPA: sugar phosphate isomerase/epimerase [Dongiaceae bacterium]|nr:sugar phosphate isomerase/epimerase [Dongiaceae bacterium]
MHRSFSLAGGFCLLTLTLAPALSLRGANPIPEECKVGGFAIGTIVYTFDHFTLFEALEKTAQAGAKVVELSAKSSLSREEPNVPFDYHALPETIEKVKAKLAQCRLKPVNYAVIPFPSGEAEARRLFEFARTMGLRAITTESPEALDLMEKLVREYDIMIALHDHPRNPNNPSYRMWDPNYVLSLVKDRDPRIGACADTGHWVRSNLKPVDCLRILKGRIVSSHLKDLNQMGLGGHDVPYGTGVSDIAGILEELKAQGFEGNLSIEYEYNWDNSLPEVAQCVGFIRGYGAAKR